MIAKKTFANSDLEVSEFLVWTHNLNNEDVIPFLTDENGKAVMISDLFSTGDELENNKANVVKVDLSGFVPFSGTWKLLLDYQSAGESVSGRRAFELDINNTPADDYRIIFGKADTPSNNMTFATLYTWLLSKLGFFKVSNNLSEGNAATMRGNLGVYSTTDVDTAVNAKATLLQSGSGAVLGVANTSIYTPTNTYHPATKGYVDSKVALKTGSYYIGDVSGHTTKTISLGTTLSTTDYLVLGSLRDLSIIEPLIWYITDRQTTNFTIEVQENGAGVQDAYFDWAVFSF